MIVIVILWVCFEVNLGEVICLSSSFIYIHKKKVKAVKVKMPRSTKLFKKMRNIGKLLLITTGLRLV